MSRQISLRVSEEIYKRLDYLAKKTHRTKSFYLNTLIENNIEEVEEAFLALDILNDKNTKYYSLDETEKKLGL
ncbi:MAG: hypothetical protein ACOCWO_02270 [Candidatus Muiribacteriaceae bacterium]